MHTTILIADDDTELCGLLGEYFETEGFQVHMAHDGKAALDQARKPGLDLVVLDHPDLDACTPLFEALKPEGPPIVAVSRGTSTNSPTSSASR